MQVMQGWSPFSPLLGLQEHRLGVWQQNQSHLYTLVASAKD